MLQSSTIKFLASLEKNNNKPWFDEHRSDYEAAKKDFEVFIDEIRKELVAIEPLLADQRAKDMVFRIFRDVRFSKDKTPYKANFGAYFCKGGKKSPLGGYYFHLQPGKSFLVGGIWMPEGPMLKAIRQEIDYNFQEFESIMNDKAFKKLFKKMEGESLKTLPQGYTADNPAIDYLKMKSFIVTIPLADADLGSKTSVSKIVKTFTLIKPLVDFLNKAVD